MTASVRTVGRTAGRTAIWPAEIYRTAVGKKYVMAITGIVGFGYVIGHMVGNLKMYLGAESLDHYAEWLRTIGEPAIPRTAFLWIARAVLILSIVLHVHAAYSLTRLSHAARPAKYTKRDYQAVTYASRTMRWGGVIILLFIVWHLADLTWGLGFANPGFERGHVYDNVAYSLARAPVAALYIVANLALGLHLYHGLFSLFQTLGFSHDRLDPGRRAFAGLFALVVTAGNVSFPIAVLAGVVG